ncbi:MAG: cytochrome P450 [Nannocystaceae bacterium]
MLPPGPRGRIRTTLRIARDPLFWYQRWRARYGDPFMVKALNGDVAVTAKPANVKAIFSARPSCFDPFAAEALRSLIGDGVILAMSGGTHLRERKLLTPPFHGARMRAYGEAMIDVAARYADTKMGAAPFVALDVATEISRDVILRAVFGVDEGEGIEAIRGSIVRFSRLVHPLLFFSVKTHRPFFGFGPWARLQPAAEEFDRLIYAKIRERKARLERGEAPGEDIMSLLLSARYEDGEAMTERHLRDTLITLLFAGHETTAVSIAWALYHVYTDDAVLGRLRDELDGVDDDAGPEDLANLPYLKAVCQETLRIHPVVPDVIRTVRDDFELDGYTIPAGKCVAVAINVLHADPEIYPEPARFNPARFLDDKPGLWTWLPFGGGHRRCIGAAFASYELALVLATIVRRYDLEVLEPEPPKVTRRNVTMGPSTGVRMRRRGLR